MSWGFHGIGKPAAVKAAIDRDVENCGPASDTNFSRLEYEEAAPALKALVDQADPDAVVDVHANGHALWTTVDGTHKKSDGHIQVEIKTIGKLLE